MAENLFQPDSAGSNPGGTTAAQNLTGSPTTGAGATGNAPTSNDTAPGNPTVTDPGATGGIPTGGGKAAPDDATLENSDTVGDDGSLDDSSGLENGAFAGNQGAQPPAPGDTSQGDTGHPTITDTDTDRSDDGGIPTGGLVGTGTNDSASRGDSGAGLGSENH